MKKPITKNVAILIVQTATDSIKFMYPFLVSVVSFVCNISGEPSLAFLFRLSKINEVKTKISISYKVIYFLYAYTFPFSVIVKLYRYIIDILI